MSEGILFLEDDRAQLVLYKHLSKKYLEDYQVYFAESVPQAEAILVKHKISLAVLDIMLPTENGADLIMKMKNNPFYKGIKIVVVSSAEKNSLIYDSLSAYIDGYVTKPVNQEKFAKLIKKILGKS